MKFTAKLSFTLLCVSIALPSMAKDGLDIGVDSKLTYDNNIFKVQDKTSDSILLVSPSAGYKGYYGKHVVIFGYDGDYAAYADNSDVNYASHKAAAKLDLSLTQKWRAIVDVEYVDKAEAAGSNNFSLTGFNDFNKYKNPSLTLITEYGDKKSVGQIVLKYNYESFDYTNNNQEFRDRTTNELTGAFYWRFAPKTRLIFELRSADLDSDRKDLFDQSFKQLSYLTGVTWEATSKTEGTLLIGYQNSDYDNPFIEDLSGLSFFADVDWRPNTDSIVKVSLSRTTRANAVRTFANLETSDYSVLWRNKLKNKLSSIARARYRVDKFGSNSSRKDQTNAISVGLTYDALVWLNIYTEIEQSKRQSDLDVYTYNNRKISIGVEIVFD